MKRSANEEKPDPDQPRKTLNQESLNSLPNRSTHLFERIEDPTREIIRKASIPEESPIRASRQTDPAKRRDVLIEASKGGNTIRQPRKGRRSKQLKDKNGRHVANKKFRPSAIYRPDTARKKTA